MCGITGFIDFSNQSEVGRLKSIICRMSDTLSHRGPDDFGFWIDEKAGIALGHRRLAIIDLSPTGHQPMISQDGRYVIVYNGEVYNFMDLRYELEEFGYTFSGRSDTEIILAAISLWGVEAALKKFNGMFAFALWDRTERRMYLTRDRIGEKPLYYGWIGNSLVFSSELKALRSYPGFDAEIDVESLSQYLRYTYIPAPYSIYKDIFKVIPATYLCIDRSKVINKKYYWSFKDTAEQGIVNAFNDNEETLLKELERLLQDSVKIRMISDVPLGAFLSGGIDSSTIVAMMQSSSSRPVKTFTIGFNEDGYNEAHYAKDVAACLGTDHTELYVNPKECLDIIPKMPHIYDEPFADSSQIPTFLVSQLTKQHVTVSLSGDGGDELFGGYNRYVIVENAWNKMKCMPFILRKLISMGITALSPVRWDKIFKWISSVYLPQSLKYKSVGDKIHKMAGILSAKGLDEIYLRLLSQGDNLTYYSGVYDLMDHKEQSNIDNFALKMMYIDTITYLPDDILVKVDRACMAVSLEGRMPFLDHRLIDFAWRLPLSMKVKGGKGKWLLRQLLRKYIPDNLIERPKMGFGVPIDLWLRTQLRDWAESLLSESALKQHGLLDSETIRKRWEQHLSGGSNWQSYLWCILIFQSWFSKSYKPTNNGNIKSQGYVRL